MLVHQADIPALAARGLVSRKSMALARTSGRFVGVSGMTPVKGSFTISPGAVSSPRFPGYRNRDWRS